MGRATRPRGLAPRPRAVVIVAVLGVGSIGCRPAGSAAADPRHEGGPRPAADPRPAPVPIDPDWATGADAIAALGVESPQVEIIVAWYSGMLVRSWIIEFRSTTDEDAVRRAHDRVNAWAARVGFSLPAEPEPFHRVLERQLGGDGPLEQVEVGMREHHGPGTAVRVELTQRHPSLETAGAETILAHHPGFDANAELPEFLVRAIGDSSLRKLSRESLAHRPPYWEFQWQDATPADTARRVTAAAKEHGFEQAREGRYVHACNAQIHVGERWVSFLPAPAVVGADPLPWDGCRGR